MAIHLKIFLPNRFNLYANKSSVQYPRGGCDPARPLLRPGAPPAGPSPPPYPTTGVAHKVRAPKRPMVYVRHHPKTAVRGGPGGPGGPSDPPEILGNVPRIRVVWVRHQPVRIGPILGQGIAMLGPGGCLSPWVASNPSPPFPPSPRAGPDRSGSAWKSSDQLGSVFPPSFAGQINPHFFSVVIQEALLAK